MPRSRSTSMPHDAPQQLGLGARTARAPARSRRASTCDDSSARPSAERGSPSSMPISPNRSPASMRANHALAAVEGLVGDGHPSRRTTNSASGRSPSLKRTSPRTSRRVAGVAGQLCQLLLAAPLRRARWRRAVFVGHGAGEGTTLARRAWGCVGDRGRRGRRASASGAPSSSSRSGRRPCLDRSLAVARAGGRRRRRGACRPAGIRAGRGCGRRRPAASRCAVGSPRCPATPR